jgi:hypothetical protein
MKKRILFFGFIGLMGMAFGQNGHSSYDSSFRMLYKAVALHPGYINREGIMNDSVIKRWDKDIRIYVECGSGKTKREILGKLKNTIALISPALNNRITIGFTNDKSAANYLINLEAIGRSGWHIKWDGHDDIYSCIMYINPRTIFNRDEQAGLVSHYFLQSLGDFVFSKKDWSDLIKNDPATSSNMSLWREDINDIDFRIVKLHYSNDIKPGMAEKEIDQFFERHGG